MLYKTCPEGYTYNQAYDSCRMKKTRSMKILVISALMPPDIIGGAEVSAFNNAHRQKESGHEVAILTTAKSRTEELHGEMIDGIRVWRIFMPRPYTVIDYANQPAWKKAIWHLQDHLDPRNRKFAAKVMDAFKPELVFAHVVQGLGWNILGEIARRNVPVTVFLHDLALACYRTSMYKGDHECKKQCAVCRTSSRFKIRQLRKIRNLKFISPSRANLERVAQFIPIRDYPHTSILNPNIYPLPTQTRSESDILRLLYVGRLDSLKGVDFLLSVCEGLAEKHSFQLTLIGGGRDEEKYRARYAEMPWCRFTGFIPQAEVSNYMNSSDLLCIPSLWFENLPGVVVQAFGLGLPVFGSSKGGIVELIEDGKNGRLLTPSDTNEWTAALAQIIKEPEKLNTWKRYAEQSRHKFSPHDLGRRIFEFSQNNQKLG